MLLLDLKRRRDHVREVRDAGGDWQRETFGETVGFALGFGIGEVGSFASIIATGLTAIGTRSPSLTLVVASGGVVATANAADNMDRSGKAGAIWIYDKAAEFLRR